MLNVSIDHIGEIAVIECTGRIVQSEAVFKLRDTVKSQEGAEIIVLDLTAVPFIEGSGAGMLVFLQHWAQTHRIRLKLFNPRQSVLDKLEQVNSMQDFDIASLDEMVALLAEADSRHALDGQKQLKAA